MQNLQTELKIQWKFASQATPSPKAKATMETLDRTRSDLSYHYDSVVQSLKRLNGQRGDGDNGEWKNPDGKPVDKKVQSETQSEKKGKIYQEQNFFLRNHKLFHSSVESDLLYKKVKQKESVNFS